MLRKRLIQQLLIGR